MGLENLLSFKANALIDGLLAQVNIPTKYVFANNTARDTYFSTNPTELVEGLLIAVGTGFQKYIDSTWTAYTGVIGIQGPKGEDSEVSTSDIINIKGEGWNGETIKGNADEISSLGGDIDDLAGEDRTTETVKENADAIIQINSSINDITNYAAVAAVEDVFTIDLENKPIKNLRIATADATAKSIALANVPSGDCEIFIELTYANAAAITWFSDIVWLSGSAPIFTAGKVYRIAFFKAGTKWHGNSVGGW